MSRANDAVRAMMKRTRDKRDPESIDQRLGLIDKKIRVDMDLLRDRAELLGHLRKTPLKKWTLAHWESLARLEMS